MTNRTIATLLAAILLIGTVSPVAAAGAMGSASNAEAQNQREAGGSVNVTVGQQLSTVMVETDSEVRVEVEESAFEVRYEAGNESERARAIAERAEELAERARALHEDYREATRAYERGEITRSEYAQRIAELNARAEDLTESIRRLQARAETVSRLELRAAGYNRSAYRSMEEELGPITGVGADAILRRFTGRSSGAVEIETRGGLSIEVKGEDGELSREIERPRDNSTAITVSQEAAFETARVELGAPPEGNWTLRRASVHEDDGYYRFRFELTGAPATGEAEVRVDGSSGAAFRLETEIEPPDPEEARERFEEEHDELLLIVTDGTPAPGATVTLQVRSPVTPVEGATVWVNDERVGTTGPNGTIELTLPEGETEITAEHEDTDGELEFEFRRPAEPDLAEFIEASGSVEDGTVTLEVGFDGEPVEGLDVYVDDRHVGTTDEDGTVTFEADVDEEIEVDARRGALLIELTLADRNGDLVLVDAETEVDEDHVEREAESPSTLAIRLVDGMPGPGEQVTVEVLLDGEATADAPVFVDGDRVGTTDEDGRITVTLPEDGDEARIEAEHGDEDARLDLPYPPTTEMETEDHRPLSIHLVDGFPEAGGTVTVQVMLGADPAPDATVFVDGDRVGTTDDGGRIDVTLPEDEDDVRIEAEHGDREARLELELVPAEEDSDG
jgi:hypothetical protein